MADTQDQPLWRVMHKAHSAVSDPFGKAIRASYAAEIRAVADWLVPEEATPELMRGPDLERLVQRKMLRQRLLDEADRAERGES